MKPEARERLRRRTTVRFVLMLIAVLLLFAAAFFNSLLRGRLFDDVSARRLETAARSLVTVFNVEQSRLLHEIALMPPLKSESDSWARAIRETMRQPVAVFRIGGNSIEWPVLPSALSAAREVAESAIRDTLSPFPVIMDTAGFFLLSQSALPSDPDHLLLLWRVEAPASGEQWGVLMDYYECWRRFLRDVRAGGTVTRLGSAVSLLESEIQLQDQGEQTSRTGLQVFLDHELIYQTPFVDTTQISLTDSLQRLRFVYYESWFDALLWKPVRGWRSWQLPAFYSLVIILMMVRCRRWIMQLTSPQTVNRAPDDTLR